MLWTVLRIVLTVALVVLLPGYLLLQAALPPRAMRYSWTQQLYLAAAGGVLLVTLVGVILGRLPHGEKGYFSTFATGSPNAELALIGISVALFFVGYQRGNYPRLWARFKKSPQTPKAQSRGPESLRE